MLTAYTGSETGFFETTMIKPNAYCELFIYVHVPNMSGHQKPKLEIVF